MFELRWADVPGPGRITIRHHPRGFGALDAEIEAMKTAGVSVLVSLLRTEEAARLGLAEEAAHAAAHGITFIQFPITDHSIPDSLEDTIAVASDLAARHAAGESIVLHCFAGIGRSALMAIATLIRAGHDLTSACDAISNARGLRVPETPEQFAMLEHIPRGPTPG